MVRHYEEQAGRPVITTEDEQRVARLTGTQLESTCRILMHMNYTTGLLASLFQGAQVFTSFLLGKLSDSIGRKPILVLGNIAGTLSMLAFGLAGTYNGAATARFVGGLLNGVIGALKTIIGESCNAADQATALGLVSLAWCVRHHARAQHGYTNFGGMCCTPPSGMCMWHHGQCVHPRPTSPIAADTGALGPCWGLHLVGCWRTHAPACGRGYPGVEQGTCCSSGRYTSVTMYDHACQAMKDIILLMMMIILLLMIIIIIIICVWMVDQV